jgi:hypothetical protein
MADKKKTIKPGPSTPAGRFAALVDEIDQSLSKAEQAALETLKNAGWQVMIQPRIQDCTTAHGLRSFQAKGRWRIGLVRDRIMR